MLKKHVIYSMHMELYLHAHNNEMTILTWCQEKTLALELTKQQIDQIFEKLRYSFPKIAVNQLKII